jgi:4a-hydroxytetrahydrobiopterin dehydratase
MSKEVLMSPELKTMKCIPCEGGAPPLSDNDENRLMIQISGWEVLRKGTHQLRRLFQFKDFKQAMNFVNKIADVAESEQHHPDLHIFYNRVEVILYTHAVNGLSENDFIVAAKINALPE